MTSFTLTSYADLISPVAGRSAAAWQACALLRAPVPDERAAILDGHSRLLKTHLDRIAAAIEALAGEAAAALVFPAAALTSPAAALAAPAVVLAAPAVVLAAPAVVLDSPAVVLAAPAAGAPDGAVLSGSAVDEVTDRIARWLLDRLGSWPDHARRLALATARLVEDGAVLQPGARRQRPLGRGFEVLFDERLRRRFALLPDRVEYLAALHGSRHLLMEDPDHAVTAIERQLGSPLSTDDRDWLDLERRVAMLRFVRKNKTADGHIRWFLRKDDRHQVVLDCFGVRGHWLVCGAGRQTDLARLGTAAERVLSTQALPHRPGPGWTVLVTAGPGLVADQEPCAAVDAAYVLPAGCVLPPGRTTGTGPTALRAEVRRHLIPVSPVQPMPVRSALSAARTAADARKTDPAHRGFALRADTAGVSLVAVDRDSSSARLVAQVGHQADDDHLLSFLDSVECVADLSVPADQIGERHRESPAAEWTRALLRLRPSRAWRTIRLVYVPSSIAHQLGGVPLIGLDFLRDRMERLGARVDILNLPPADFERRVDELLGADVVGIGTYIHNHRDVADLVALLRRSGFTGKIVLGGPQLRDIDQIQSTIDGWDALVRGEAEDVLPQVLEVLSDLDAGRWAEALARARTLTGVAIRYGDAVLLCDTAARNRAETISCPLPFDWMRGKSTRKLQMNFTRGCPYLCTFCPNHQGQRFRAGPVDQLWRFTAFAVADDLPLPAQTGREIARRVQDHLGVRTTPRLRVALHLLLRTRCPAEQVHRLFAPLYELVDPRVVNDRAELLRLVGLPDVVGPQPRGLACGPLSAWRTKEAWLVAKLALLASRQLWRRTNQEQDRQEQDREDQDREDQDRLQQLEAAARPAFVLATSEDNTLVNRRTVLEYLQRRTHFGLDGDVIFNPGQNTIWDLTDKNGGADEEYIAALVDRNPFAVALGADGPSNAVIRQSRKPRYGVREVLAVNRALARRGVQVANNYILLAPETDLLEAVEAFTLFVMLPVPWRDYGNSVNLRVIKEEGTLAHDEGLVFSAGDPGWDEPMRFPEVDRLLNRWSLTSQLAASDLPPLLWKILREDEQVTGLLPHLVERWLRDFDSDPELVAIGREVSARSCPGVPLVDTLRAVAQELAENFPA